jgi:hypothetical protein
VLVYGGRRGPTEAKCAAKKCQVRHSPVHLPEKRCYDNGNKFTCCGSTGAYIHISTLSCPSLLSSRASGGTSRLPGNLLGLPGLLVSLWLA